MMFESFLQGEGGGLRFSRDEPCQGLGPDVGVRLMLKICEITP